MSATWAGILAGMVQRGTATRMTLAAAHGRRIITTAEHDDLVEQLERAVMENAPDADDDDAS